jgi:amidase
VATVTRTEERGRVGASDLTLASAEEQLAALRSREVSSEELTRAYLDRIGRYDGELNAVVSLDEEGALAAARSCDEADEADRGELHGLPLTIKDGWEVAGVRSTAGIPGLKNYVPTRDSRVVGRVRRAGAVILGKTNIPTANADFQTSNPIFGRTNNPWDLSRTPGGSCGGGAAAVASGMTGLELGSEIGGSLRLPAHFCGIYGHKSSAGITPTTNHLPPGPGEPGRYLEPDLVVAGGMARAAGDLEILLRTIAGPAPERAVAWRLELPGRRAGDLGEFRIAVWFDDPFIPLDDEVRAVLGQAADALTDAGARLDFKPPLPVTLEESHRVYEALLFAAFSTDRSTYSAKGTAYFLRSALRHPRGQATRTMKLIRQRHEQWLHHHMKRLEMQASWNGFFAHYDAVLMPITASVAPPHHGKDHDRFGRTYTVNGEERNYFEQPVWSGVANLIGSPATALPAGRTRTGMPVGLQILGPLYGDLTTIELARRIGKEVGGFVAPPGYESGAAVGSRNA